MCCVLSILTLDDTWKCINIFHIYAKCGSKTCKIMIDSGSCMNIISIQALSKIQVNPEPHWNPYKVKWVDHTSFLVTQRCLASIEIRSYKDNIWSNILPMDVAHAILDRPWLFYLSITHYSWKNTYLFKHSNQNIWLYLAKYRNPKSNLSR